MHNKKSQHSISRKYNSKRLSLFGVLLSSLFVSSVFASESDDELDIDFMGEIELEDKSDKSAMKFRGFIDSRWGKRLETSDYTADQRTIVETRIQGQTQWQWSGFQFNVKGDIYHDDILDSTELDWREVYLETPDSPHYSLRVGRQNIMWGFGDNVAANDVFAKDYTGFYIGRDSEAEYIVKASDGVRANLFFDQWTWEVIALKFTPHNAPPKSRLSYFNPLSQQIENSGLSTSIKEADNWSLMTRLNTKLWGNEFGLFYANTRALNPEGYLNDTGQSFYPTLETIGMNMRGELGFGVLAYDGAYYRYQESDSNVLVPSNVMKHIIAYDVELASDRSLGLQLYYEKPSVGQDNQNADYNLATLRLTQKLLSQKMTLSLFVYHSLTQNDTYYRLNVFHKFDDQWMLHIGLNQFSGDESARFGQFQHNSNIFAALRWNF